MPKLPASLLIAALLLAPGARGTPPTASAPAPQSTAAAGDDGRALFTGGTTPSCATCHALRDAGATGNIGPDLDELKPDAPRVANAVKRGFEAMPAFGHVLSDRQIETLARYVAQATGT
jgi:mono/diheme cytochrome c family protein